MTLKNLQTISLILLVSFFFTACGGGSSGNTVQDTAIDKLIAYAESKGTSEVPTLQDYIDAGVVGVNDETKLAEINEVISRLTEKDVDTTKKVQALAQSLGVEVPEETVATPNTTVSTPTRPSDRRAPVITLNGDNPQSLEKGTAYTELNASTDDGSTVDINSSSVDTNTVGTYGVTYNSTDASGNKAIEIIRTVNVVDSIAPVITLTGANPQIIQAGTAYTELGASTDDGSTIVINSSSVNTNTLGTYTVTYNATDASANSANEVTRTVNVIDTTAPVITLNGSSALLIAINSTYNELGATANDNRDGSVSVSISGSVNTSTLGVYDISYTAFDSLGNSSTVFREVTVSRFTSDATLKVVVDHIGGRMWNDHAVAPGIRWIDAPAYCSGLSVGGVNDWQVPPIEILETIQGFPSFVYKSRNKAYWSSTQSSSTEAWLVNLSQQFLNRAEKTYEYRVICYRVIP